VYKQELDDRLLELTNEGVVLYDRIEELKISDPGSDEIVQLERQLFTNESAKQVIESKIDMGYPYGLTINSVSNRVKNKTSYTQSVNQLKSKLNEIDETKATAKQSGVDLKGGTYTTNYQTVPPVVTFKNN